MESTQAVRRRMNAIAAHLAAPNGNGIEDFTATASQLLPLNCSSSFGTPIRRFDNRMHYARQGSASQGCFMRQVSTEERKLLQPGNNVAEAPCFSRPARVQHSSMNPCVSEPTVQNCKFAAPEPPKFARPSRLAREEQQFMSIRGPASPTNGIQWSPNMNVAESRNNYTVFVELPGINVRDIRVEVNDRNLVITGKRGMKWKTAGYGLDESYVSYQRREIIQGPYQVVWQLPANANKEAVSAEFV